MLYLTLPANLKQNKQKNITPFILTPLLQRWLDAKVPWPEFMDICTKKMLFRVILAQLCPEYSSINDA